jgi:glycine/D-amino acid oxidase-like deaminating enzyme
MSGRPSSVTVVGAGVFGVTSALELCRRGHEVKLLDAGPVPHPDASSTDVSKVVRMDYGSDAFYTDMGAAAIDGWRAWNRDWEEPLYHECGILLLSGDRLEQGGFEADGLRMMQRRGTAVVRLDPTALAARFPAWSGAGFADGYFNPHGGYAESGRVVARLKRVACEAGVRLHERVRCTGLVEEGSRVTGVALAGDRVWRSDTVVVAAGAWTPLLLPQLSEFMWATGQPVVQFRPSDPRPFEASCFPVWCADVRRTGRYGFPLNREGLVKVARHGRGRRFMPGDALVIDDDEEEQCIDFVRRTFPALADAPVEQTRLCLYCDTWDGDFLIDHDPRRPGLVVAAGGSGHGFKFAPLIGDIVADVVEGKPNARAARFAWRRPGPRRTEQTRQRA